jgi:hypothetical protein
MNDPLGCFPSALRPRLRDLPVLAWVAARAFTSGPTWLRPLAAAGTLPVWLMFLGHHSAAGRVFSHDRRALLVLGRREPLRTAARRRRQPALLVIPASLGLAGLAAVMFAADLLVVLATGRSSLGTVAGIGMASLCNLPILLEGPDAWRGRRELVRAERDRQVPTGDDVLLAALAAAWPQRQDHFTALAEQLQVAAQGTGLHVVAVARAETLAAVYERRWGFRRIEPESLILRAG